MVAAAVMGACFGFLWWNAPPAKIFMGDTGSLALGGALAGLAIITRTELLLLLLGGLFVIITMSVVIQVGSYKLTHKRVFRMAPLQHHFELAGWAETTIVVRFWLIAGMFVALGLGIFYVGWFPKLSPLPGAVPAAVGVGLEARLDVREQVGDRLDARPTAGSATPARSRRPTARAAPRSTRPAEAGGGDDQPAAATTASASAAVAGELEGQQRPEAARHLQRATAEAAAAPGSGPPSPAGARPGTARSRAALSDCRAIRSGSVFIPRSTSQLSNGPGMRAAEPSASRAPLGSSAASRVTTAPPSTSECPEIDLVSE